MGVIIGQTNPLTGDYYCTWGKLRSPILGKDVTGGVGTAGTHSIEYDAGSGFQTDNDTPVRFDMRYDSTTWPNGFWRPTFLFSEVFAATPPGWYGEMFVPQTLTDEDKAELVGETVVASGTIGTFTMTSDFFTSKQLLQAGSGFTPPYPVEQPILSVGKLNAF